MLEELEIDPDEYARTRVLQPITGFRTSCIGGPPVETRYETPVSYGIRRFEFDDYLLKRSGACLVQGESLTHLERSERRLDSQRADQDSLAGRSGRHILSRGAISRSARSTGKSS